MLVETCTRKPGDTGLIVGVENVQRFFPTRTCDIELHLGHLQIQSKLHPDFWQGKPEIFDERLSSWLESKYLHGKPDRRPLILAMVPVGTGKNAFRLRPVSLDDLGKEKQGRGAGKADGHLLTNLFHRH
jgi:hypothetical protein